MLMNGKSCLIPLVIAVKLRSYVFTKINNLLISFTSLLYISQPKKVETEHLALMIGLDQCGIGNIINSWIKQTLLVGDRLWLISKNNIYKETRISK